jgi:two-component system CitB family sensor kinase
MPHRARTVSAQILVAMLIALVVAGAAAFGLSVRAAQNQAGHESEQRALAIATTTATMPEVVDTLEAHVPPAAGGPIASLAALVQQRTGASYVVVIDRTGIRYSHPNPSLIGQKVAEPVVALDGRDHVGIDHGNLGVSANARAPVFGAGGRPIGEVSVGVLESRVSAQAWAQVRSLAAYAVVALLVGGAVALLLSRRLKRQTFGLELDDLASLLQEREATLHGIHEGVVAVDPEGRIALINDQAHELLHTPPAVIGQTVDVVFPPGRLADLLTGRKQGADQMVLSGERLLVINRKLVTHHGKDLGSVVTLRDRTEVEQALRELDDVRSFTGALRAQQHEFSNRMHTVAGLLELGHTDEALRYVSDVTGGTAGLAGAIEARISSRLIIALLVAKTAVAAERGVTLSVTGDSRLEVDDDQAAALVSILGNLIDNAIDAAAGSAGAGVRVRTTQDATTAVIEVVDTGPGIPADVRDLVFTDGWSTKPASGDRPRGLGLALVAQLARRLGGEVTVGDGPGGMLRVRLPSRPVATTSAAP